MHRRRGSVAFECKRTIQKTSRERYEVSNYGFVCESERDGQMTPVVTHPDRTSRVTMDTGSDPALMPHLLIPLKLHLCASLPRSLWLLSCPTVLILMRSTSPRLSPLLSGCSGCLCESVSVELPAARFSHALPGCALFVCSGSEK